MSLARAYLFEGLSPKVVVMKCCVYTTEFNDVTGEIYSLALCCIHDPFEIKKCRYVCVEGAFLSSWVVNAGAVGKTSVHASHMNFAA